ncbi:phosphatase PAP2 family protein [Streptomyces sp. NPDC057963]|uniref:phosphatase PAP2 family protein n=1 Tax=Streptomyces sp. NPDC057963 TaxID=3346290 RepID=UPI0036EA40D4
MRYAGSEPADREPDSSARPPLVRELLLVVGLFVIYKLGRQAANGHVEEAYRNAGNVWDFERSAHLPGEGAVQRLLLHDETLIHLANTYYATVHFPATLLFLGWLYWRRPRHYVWSRRILAALTGAALALHLLFPLAPPRLLAAAGLVDTGQVYGPTVYGATPATDSMANQFAAMPSLHFGWAVMVAVGLIVATRTRWRWLWLLHPLVTLLVIVGTANHYWLDSIVVSALFALAFAALPLRRTQRVRAHLPWHPPASAPAPAAVPRPAEPAASTAGAAPQTHPAPSYASSGARR